MPYAFSSDVANDKFIIAHFSSMQLDSLETLLIWAFQGGQKIIVHDKQLLKLSKKSKLRRVRSWVHLQLCQKNELWPLWKSNFNEHIS